MNSGKFAVGALVRITSRPRLKYHQIFMPETFHLTEDQFEFAKRDAFVANRALDAEGDAIYQLVGCPGIWHEDTLWSPALEADPELFSYLWSYCGVFTRLERAACAHLLIVNRESRKLGFRGAEQTGPEAQAAVRSEHERRGVPSYLRRRRRSLSDDPEVLGLAAEGLAAFMKRTLDRILAEYGDRLVVNRCPKCSGITRTATARLCLHCGYSWHPVAL